ncbi:MAG: enoyl-CoA hydratase/isomerase family protein, partial [Alphaproteobacteria bacterium]|nr:enoyl-CoA hydratase/isomerase family protein [Alphaproteobacteria bacterium]
AVSGDDKDWAQKVASELREKSPVALKVTHRHIQASRELDLRQTLLVDYTLASNFLQCHDFPEGVRAQLIDKDGAPDWNPSDLADVTPDMVNDFFKPVSDDAFSLPTRQQMQAARS